MSTLKRDTWPSRAVAVDKARQVFQRWDPRVLDLWAQYGYREVPSPTPGDAVTLATTKHQETLLYGRLAPIHTSLTYDRASYPQIGLPLPTMRGPDWHISTRSEAFLSARMVVYLRPPVLYLSGARSAHCQNGMHKQLADRTGTAFDEHRVQHVVIDKAGHSLPQEQVGATAEAIRSRMAQEMQQWQHKQGEGLESTLPAEWVAAVHNSRRPAKI